MIFVHSLDDIKDYTIARYSPVLTQFVRSQTALNSIKNDIWDFHWNYRRLWEQHFKRKYYSLRIKFTRTTFRQLTATSTHNYIFAPGSLIVQPPQIPPVPAGVEGDVLSQAPGDGDPSGVDLGTSPYDGRPAETPAAGNVKIYWRTNRCRGHISTTSGILILTTDPVLRYGSFDMPNPVFNMGVTPGFTSSVDRNDLIDDYLTARLNYRSFLDLDVVRQNESPAPAKTNLVIDVTSIVGEGSFSDWVIRADVIQRRPSQYITRSSTELNIATGSQAFAVSAGLGFIEGTEVTATSPTGESMSGKITQYNNDDNDKFKSPRGQVISGLQMASQFNVTQGALNGPLTYLFPGRTDIRPAVLRWFAEATAQRDFRNFGDVWGIEVDGPDGFGREFFPPESDEFAAGRHVTFITDPHPSGVDLYNGVDNSVITSVDNDVVGTDGPIIFRTRTEHHGQRIFVNVKLTSELT